MGTYTRGLPALVVGAAIMVSPLAGQENVGTGSFKFYFGAYAGATMFETTAQDDKVDPTVGAQIFVTARRTALRLSVEQTFTTDNLAAYPDPSAPGGVQQVSFNNIRKYSLMLIGIPLQGAIQPYLGLGVGWMHTVNTYVLGSPSDPIAAREEAVDRGSVGFGSAMAGLQIRMKGVAVFGTWQITSAPDEGKLFVGSTHSFTGGVRLSLGPARETY
jgi:hypothetical protein